MALQKNFVKSLTQHVKFTNSDQNCLARFGQRLSSQDWIQGNPCFGFNGLRRFSVTRWNKKWFLHEKIRHFQSLRKEILVLLTFLFTLQNWECPRAGALAISKQNVNKTVSVSKNCDLKNEEKTKASFWRIFRENVFEKDNSTILHCVTR